MTIKRQYSLPNCTLILEGLSDNSVDSNSTTGLMSILVNAECHFLGSNKVLSGGRVFFESLVKSVSVYAQEFLSGLHHPQPSKDNSNLVHIAKMGDINRHRLTLLPESSSENSTQTPSQQVEVDLTTVQLFDLMEAIDQFFADSRTLPDLALNLRPLSKRHRQAEEPFVQRATPAAVGIAGLAAFAFAFSLIPPPAIRKPEPKPQVNPSQTLPNTPSSPNNNTSNPNSSQIPTQTPSSTNSSIPTPSQTAPKSVSSPTDKNNLNPNPSNVPPPITIPSKP
ncbi:MAG: DUF4335 domain-containing protein [Xenococcaceae cyanobacterium]